jgi:hypothetical protein
VYDIIENGRNVKMPAATRDTSHRSTAPRTRRQQPTVVRRRRPQTVCRSEADVLHYTTLYRYGHCIIELIIYNVRARRGKENENLLRKDAHIIILCGRTPASRRETIMFGVRYYYNVI